MITLMKTIDHRGDTLIEVSLDVSLKNYGEPASELRELFEQCRSTKRKVGSIWRKFGGNTYFTYDPNYQPQVEVALLAALSMPKSEVHVTQGGYSECDKY